ncbi:MAG: multidrug efflux pump subunit AcrB [Lentisphaeria bacterium]|jgi:multidrug efflux pump subunit AcrB
MAFVFSISLVSNGYVERQFQSNPPMDWVVAEIAFPEDYPQEDLMATVHFIPLVEGDKTLEDKGYGENFILHNLTWVHENRVWVVLELAHDSELNLDPGLIATRWRSYIGELPNIEKFELGYTANDNDADIALDLFAYDIDTLDRASQEVALLLKAYAGVHSVRDSLETARDDIDISLKPGAEVLGVSLGSTAKHVRQGYFGQEAQRIPRLNEDVRVRVSYPKQERSTVERITDIRVKTADNREVPFEAVAEVNFVPGFTRIERTDRRSSIQVTGDITEGQANTNFVMEDFMAKHKDNLEQKYAGLKVGKGGNSQEEQEFMAGLLKAFAFSLLPIYALMSIEFKSYVKPLGVLSAVPFGIMGATFGHWIMGFAIDIASFFGILAAAGVVVNDNLGLIDRINQLRRENVPVRQALMQASRDRFRPIVLTSLTTIIGLVTIMLDSSMQARFLMPIVVSLAFGVLFATFITLLFVPVLYLAGAKLRKRIRGRSTVAADVEVLIAEV